MPTAPPNVASEPCERVLSHIELPSPRRRGAGSEVRNEGGTAWEVERPRPSRVNLEAARAFLFVPEENNYEC